MHHKMTFKAARLLTFFPNDTLPNRLKENVRLIFADRSSVSPDSSKEQYLLRRAILQ